MILERYQYKYALIPYAVARKMGLGWRKADTEGMILLNLSEIKQLPGEGTEQERVETLGGRMMEPEEANYYRHTNNFSFVTAGPEPPQEEQPDESPAPLPDDSDNIDPGFSQEVIPEDRLPESEAEAPSGEENSNQEPKTEE